ncbi:MAG: putative Serine/threonine-protein phosphatase 5, partial [Streblomastix strix]
PMNPVVNAGNNTGQEGLAQALMEQYGPSTKYSLISLYVIQSQAPPSSKTPIVFMAIGYGKITNKLESGPEEITIKDEDAYILGDYHQEYIAEFQRFANADAQQQLQERIRLEQKQKQKELPILAKKPPSIEEGIPCESCGNLIPSSEFEKHNAEHQRDIDNARALREVQPKFFIINSIVIIIYFITISINWVVNSIKLLRKFKQQRNPLDVPNPMTPDYPKMLLGAFSKSQRLKILQVNAILLQGRKLLKKLSNIIEGNVPQEKQITIVGDLHGQFFDLLEIFKRNGKPSNENPYLFLGNYVDYKTFGTEIFILLLCYKLAYPQSVHLLRGNHESSLCTKKHGFMREVEDKYSTAVYQNFLLVFNTLPICAIINSCVFVVHGGLFNRRNVTLEKIRQINRFTEPGEEGGEVLMAQMLWSVPTNLVGQNPKYEFGPNITDV